jgi:hypothetical protein
MDSDLHEVSLLEHRYFYDVSLSGKYNIANDWRSLPVCESGEFFVHFSVLPDPRINRSKKHLLVDILFIAVCTII